MAKNQDKGNPEAYCGAIKHRVEGAMQAQGASGLNQVQQIVDPNNASTPEDDDLPAGVAFPINDALAEQWVTGPDGAKPRGKKEGARRSMRPSNKALRMFGRMDAMEGKSAHHRDTYPFGAKGHGQYLRGWNETRASSDAILGRDPMARDLYAQMTGRADLHPHYLSQYAAARGVHSPDSPYAGAGAAAGESVVSVRRQADTLSQPHQTTDDAIPPYNSPATTPQPFSSNADPVDSDFQAGMAAGKADKAAGQRPSFADNSSGVSPYVKGYAAGYGAAGTPQGAQDVPASMGGDSGQAASAQEAQRAFQVARASRISAAFAPEELMRNADFRKGYLFASKWQPGQRLVATGSAAFEAGMYCAITDRAEVQQAWLAQHAGDAGKHHDLAKRIALHTSFTAKTAGHKGLRAQGAYLVREAAVSTDLITDGPGTSPDPMGATPLNGPGTPPPMGGLGEAAAPGGAPPYQGAPPLSGGPVVPDDVMGRPQRDPQPDGPFTNTFSGQHPENATLAPVAPNSADQPGYSNRDAYRGDPGGGDRVAKLAAFRNLVQSGLVPVEGAAIHEQVHRHLRRARQAFSMGLREYPHLTVRDLSELTHGAATPRQLEGVLGDLVAAGRARPGAGYGEWEAAE